MQLKQILRETLLLSVPDIFNFKMNKLFFHSYMLPDFLKDSKVHPLQSQNPVGNTAWLNIQ